MVAIIKGLFGVYVQRGLFCGRSIMLVSHFIQTIPKMIYLYVRQTVSDYAQWKETFDLHLAARQAGGATAQSLLLRNVDDPHEIIIVLGWSDLVQARMFVQSVSWQDVIIKAGIVDPPEVCFLEGV